MIRLAPLVALTLMAAPTLASAELGDARPNWALSAFGGRFVDNDFDELINPAAVDAEDAGAIGLALSRRLWEPIDGLDIEIEAQLFRHFGAQDHWEVNAPLVARWNRFPWDGVVDTSYAFGLGLSFASEAPSLETQIEGETSAVLAYWVAEVELAAPGSDWSVVGRLHHRSTAFGLFGDDGGANLLMLGVRRRF